MKCGKKKQMQTRLSHDVLPSDLEDIRTKPGQDRGAKRVKKLILILDSGYCFRWV